VNVHLNESDVILLGGSYTFGAGVGKGLQWKANACVAKAAGTRALATKSLVVRLAPCPQIGIHRISGPLAIQQNMFIFRVD